MTTIQTAAPTLAPEAHADTRAVLLNQVSWGAIFAGATTALVTQLILNLVGVGVGLASVGGSAADNPAASTVSLGAGLWFVASGIVASLAGGAIAGRLSGKTLPGAAALHGQRSRDGVGHEALVFETAERRVHGTDGHVPAGPRFDRPPDGGAVGVGAEAGRGQQHVDLEFAEEHALGHGPIFYINT